MKWCARVKAQECTKCVVVKELIAPNFYAVLTALWWLPYIAFFTRLQLIYKYRLIYHTVCKITLTFFMDFQNDCSWTLGFGQPINFNIWERLIRLKVKKDTTHSYTAQLFNALKVQGIVILSLKTLKVLDPLSVEECSEFDNLWLVEVFTACNHGNDYVTP